MKSADEKRVEARLRNIAVVYSAGNVTLDDLATKLADLSAMIEIMLQERRSQALIQDLKDDI